MLSKSLVSILALTSMVSASPALRRQAQSTDNCVAKDNKCRTTRGADGLSANQAQCSADNAKCQGDCYAAYNTCRTTRGADGLSANQAQCVSNYASCLGENPVASTGGLISSFIPYSATASTLTTSVSSKASSATAAATTSAAAAIGCKAKDNKCRTTRSADGLSANQAQCSADNAQCQGDCYAALTKCQTTRGADGLSANQAACIGQYATCLGENPIASSGGIISSFIPYTATASTMATSTAKASSASSAPATTTAAPGSNPKKVSGKTWTLNNVNRYCGENSNTCDYNFDIVADGKTEHCTIVNASNKSFSGQKCANGDYTVSWGYVANPAPAFAVVTVVDKQNELAWFGVSNVDGQAVTASNPKGSGQYGNVGPEQVYTYN
ncbi:hypothetical protein E4T50_05864 [Aureobasidium sp. EXF-12298]|nr:hypothetical protein E4T50_05864 [Aureobasidium sp. EXF-12298]